MKPLSVLEDKNTKLIGCKSNSRDIGLLYIQNIRNLNAIPSTVLGFNHLKYLYWKENYLKKNMELIEHLPNCEIDNDVMC